MRTRLSTALAGALLGLWLILPAAGSAAAETYVVALNHAPPYRIIEGGEGERRFSGFYVDIVREMAKRVGIELRFKEVPFRRALLLMELGGADLMIGPNRTPAREVFMLYLDVEISRERKAFYQNPGDADMARYADLAGKRIGVLRGATYFDRFDRDRGLLKWEVATYPVALRMVARKRLDTVIVPELLGDYLVRESGLGLRKATLTAPGKPSYIAISRQSPLVESRSRLESALSEMEADGTLERITRRYR